MRKIKAILEKQKWSFMFLREISFASSRHIESRFVRVHWLCYLKSGSRPHLFIHRVLICCICNTEKCRTLWLVSANLSNRIFIFFPVTKCDFLCSPGSPRYWWGVPHWCWLEYELGNLRRPHWRAWNVCLNFIFHFAWFSSFYFTIFSLSSRVLGFPRQLPY